MNRWRNRPEGSNWGDFGPSDQVGKMNLVTPERRRAAAAEIREGIAFCLSLPLEYPGYSERLSGTRKPPKLFAPGSYNSLSGPRNHDHSEVICDDGVILCTQYSTQWDALSHYGRLFDLAGDGREQKTYYNGFTTDDFVQPDQQGGPIALSLGIQNLATTCVQGRGVLVDLAAAFGSGRRWVGYEDFMSAMDSQNVKVEPGDFLMIHTGFGEAVMELGSDVDVDRLNATGAVLDGGDQRLLQWIAESGVAAICSDNQAVEGFDLMGERQGTGLLLPLHDLCLFKQGIHLGELWYLTELVAWMAKNRRNAFMLTAPPLRLTGAVGSPATPVATV
jgi:kynurenine formamidase